MVWAGFPISGRTAYFSRILGWTARGASIRSESSSTLPWTIARYVFLIVRRSNWPARRQWASSVLAMRIRPVVSRSRRWMMPGRQGSEPVEREELVFWAWVGGGKIREGAGVGGKGKTGEG